MNQIYKYKPSWINPVRSKMPLASAVPPASLTDPSNWERPKRTSNGVKISLLALGLIALITGGYFLVRKIWPAKPIKTYEVLVAVTDQKTSDPVEDARSSLKAGDVMVILPEGHPWSATEKNSYLILKMRLTEEQAKNLLAPEQKKIKQDIRNTEQKTQNKEKGPQMETVRARVWRLKIETLGFDVEKFWENQIQPYQDKVFDWKLVEKKPKIK